MWSKFTYLELILREPELVIGLYLVSSPLICFVFTNFLIFYINENRRVKQIIGLNPSHGLKRSVQIKINFSFHVFGSIA